MNSFQKTVFATLIATFLLISLGSLVRTTGAGLGCPDWPKCWGTWLPPTTVQDLDPTYLSKNGYDSASFNSTKMWIEYANRLVGVAIGILVLATFLRAFRYKKTSPQIFYGAGIAFILVVFQGWLGGQVVESGLRPGIITLHMLLAVILLWALLYIAFKSLDERFKFELKRKNSKILLRLATVLMAVTMVQLLLGSQVREGIDPFIADDGGLPRGEWLSQVGFFDHLHRFFSWFVLFVGSAMYWAAARFAPDTPIVLIVRYIFFCILFQILLGIILAYGDLPKIAQVLHLTLAILLICFEFVLLIIIKMRPSKR
tara:strand:+ start:61370 stop:62311 length:942 start_codon:yes stop_codon:yes gene_type:complete